jgi:hypothetical protein
VIWEVWGSITLTFTDGIAVSFLRSGRKQAHVRVGAFGKPFGKPSRNRVRSSYRPKFLSARTSHGTT